VIKKEYGVIQLGDLILQVHKFTSSQVHKFTSLQGGDVENLIHIQFIDLFKMIHWSDTIILLVNFLFVQYIGNETI